MKTPLEFDPAASVHATTDGIRVGIGGWTYTPWRETFYPPGLVQRRELEYASRQVSSIEINGTWYTTQPPKIYAKWRDETPADFVFALKAPKRITMARSLAQTAGAIADFLGDIVTLQHKLGPIVWQFERGRKPQGEDFAAFLALLPKQVAGFTLRHVLDLRDAELITPDYIAEVRKHGFATVFTDSDEYPSYADLSADFVYARLMRSRATLTTGYTAPELAAWAERARRWAAGAQPDDLPQISSAAPAKRAKRDVFVYFISAAKERNPAAAMALLEKLGAR